LIDLHQDHVLFVVQQSMNASCDFLCCPLALCSREDTLSVIVSVDALASWTDLLVQIYSPAFTGVVVAPVSLSKITNFLEIFLVQNAVQRLEILSRPVGMACLWNDRSATRDTPSQNDLSRRAITLLCDLCNDGVVEQLGQVAFIVSRVCTSQRRICLDGENDQPTLCSCGEYNALHSRSDSEAKGGRPRSDLQSHGYCASGATRPSLVAADMDVAPSGGQQGHETIDSTRFPSGVG
jgi:hypothetical protein